MRWRVALVALAFLWHLGGLVQGLRDAPNDWCGDFASYYYAVRVAGAGGDPYVAAELVTAARADGYRRAVFPFVYPPFALALMSWTQLATIRGAYRVWFVLNYAALFGIGLVLCRWWRGLHAGLAWIVPAALAGFHPILNGLFQGQVNLLELALTLTGLWLGERRPLAGGAFVGAAVATKLSPAPFLLWWLLHRRWRAFTYAWLTLLLLIPLSLPWAPLRLQWEFVSRVLPTVGGDAQAWIRVPIEIFGNWSTAALFERILPSSAALLLAWSTAAAVVLGLALACARSRPSGWTGAAQVGAVGVCVLFVPPYTFEHHLVWALPALIVASAAAAAGHGPARSSLWRVSLAVAWVLLATPLPLLRSLQASPPLAPVVGETKLAGLVLLLAMCVILARREPSAA